VKIVSNAPAIFITTTDAQDEHRGEGQRD